MCWSGWRIYTLSNFIYRNLRIDPSYEGLMQSLKNGDLQSAFRAAHTLKGIGYNLGLNRLGDRAAALCEVLHTGSVPAPELLRQLTEEYCCVIDAIHELKSEI